LSRRRSSYKIHKTHSFNDIFEQEKQIRPLLSKYIDNKNPAVYTQKDLLQIKCKNEQLLKLSSSKFRELKFEFEDEQMYRIYVDLCQKRDSIPPLSKETVQNLMDRDPIFKKRYREYLQFRAKYKAPNFELKDNYFMPSISRAEIDTQIQHMEKQNPDGFNVNSAPNKLPNLNIDHVLEKAKKFLNDIYQEDF
jgi:hypothetical protein